MSQSHQTVSRQTIFAGKIIDVYLDKILLPDGRDAMREVVEHDGGVIILAIVDDDVLMVRQYRHPTGQDLLELPAGTLEKGEDPAHCAARELEEETGYRPERVSELGRFYATPGYGSEIFYLYLAEGLTPTAQKLDDDELLDIERIPFDDAIASCFDGRIVDAKTALTLLLLKNRQA